MLAALLYLGAAVMQPIAAFAASAQTERSDQCHYG